MALSRLIDLFDLSKVFRAVSRLLTGFMYESVRDFVRDAIVVATGLAQQRGIEVSVERLSYVLAIASARGGAPLPIDCRTKRVDERIINDVLDELVREGVIEREGETLRLTLWKGWEEFVEALERLKLNAPKAYANIKVWSTEKEIAVMKLYLTKLLEH